MIALVKEWQGIKSCSKRDLLSIIGHACKVFRAGRSFLRCLIDLPMMVDRRNRKMWQLGPMWRGGGILAHGRMR